MSKAPIVIIGYGNPSRGDDAVGPLLIEALQQEQQGGKGASAYALITDFQLQIEHVTDLEQRHLILFVDASLSTAPPFEFSRLKPCRDHSYSSHSLSPASLLSVYEAVYKMAPPPAYLLEIPGYQFELGRPLSHDASIYLEQAKYFIQTLIKDPGEAAWEHWLPRH